MKYLKALFNSFIKDEQISQKIIHQKSISNRGNYFDKAQAKNCFSGFKAGLIENCIFESIGRTQSKSFTFVKDYYN